MDKVQKIYEEVVRMHDLLPVMDGDNISVNYADRICTTLEMYIDSLQEEHKKCMYTKDHYIDDDRKFLCEDCKEKCEYSKKEEPVSEDLEEAMQHNAPNNIGIDDLLYWRNGFIAGAKWQKEQFEKDCTDLCNGIATAKGIAVAMAYDKGMADAREQMMKNIWKPADGDDLPEIDKEVIAILDNGKVVFAHRPNPEGWDAMSIITEKVERYIPKTYGKGGWNIPDVKYWLDCSMPKEIEP